MQIISEVRFSTPSGVKSPPQRNSARAGRMSSSRSMLTVGEVDGDTAMCSTESLLVVRLPLALLPPGVAAGECAKRTCDCRQTAMAAACISSTLDVHTRRDNRPNTLVRRERDRHGDGAES